MSLVQDDHVIQAFAANTPDEPLDVRILPRTPWGDQHFFNPHMLHPLPKRGAIDAVPIAQQIPRGLVPRKGVHHLLSRPLRRRVFRDVEMDDAAPFMGQDEQHEEHFVGHRRHDKEIQGDQVLHVVVRERSSTSATVACVAAPGTSPPSIWPRQCPASAVPRRSEASPRWDSPATSPG